MDHDPISSLRITVIIFTNSDSFDQRNCVHPSSILQGHLGAVCEGPASSCLDIVERYFSPPENVKILFFLFMLMFLKSASKITTLRTQYLHKAL